jgi:hypothetical protein
MGSFEMDSAHYTFAELLIGAGQHTDSGTDRLDPIHSGLTANEAAIIRDKVQSVGHRPTD